MPTIITKQNKNKWVRNRVLHSYHFMQFQYKPLLDLSKNFEERTQTTKNT